MAVGCAGQDLNIDRKYLGVTLFKDENDRRHIAENRKRTFHYKSVKIIILE